MSNAPKDGPGRPRRLFDGARAEARFGLRFLHARWRRLALAFAGVLLPLWAFGELADEVREAEAFPFDAPLLQFARSVASEDLDCFFVPVARLGYEWGVVPFDVLLVLALAALRRLREGLFAGVALGGSALLNVGAKQLFARQRPSLWESIAPETTFSFPSGHAMGSMTLAMVLAMLAWHTRLRWWIVLPMAGFVLAVGTSRVYLGVHYPSDIAAGWAAACAWTVAAYLLVFAHRQRPWRD